MQALTLLLLATLLALTGCGPSQSRDGQSDLLRYRDDKNGVTCWAINGGHSISCLPDSQLRQQATQSSSEGRASPANSARKTEALQATPFSTVERMQL
ncbi:MAG TPA: hypothetical protein VF682_26125 [Pseudomonas sp.]|jgi:hypothetical protein